MPIASYILFGIAGCMFVYAVLLGLSALGRLSISVWFPGRGSARADLERSRAELRTIEKQLRQLGDTAAKLEGTAAKHMYDHEVQHFYEHTVPLFDKGAHRLGLPKYERYEGGKRQ